MTTKSDEWYHEILAALATEYKQWFQKYEIEFVSWEELGELLNNGLDEGRIWTLEDLWDGYHFTLSNGNEITYRGSGYLPFFGGYPASDETQYAISEKELSSSDKSVFNQVLIPCVSCVDEDGDEDSDPDCEFCEGQLEVRFDLNQDGTYDLA
jgi:hypothetical protein